MTVKVGCCGYPVSMKKYRELFQVVELNNTFYQYPKDSTVEKWRKESPEEFEFTVKAHQEITHKHRLKFDLAADAFNRMKKICHMLRARILLIQTPPSFTPDHLGDAEEFFRNVKREDLTLIWETRGNKWETPDARERLQEVLEELDVPHVTDPFRAMPVYTGCVAYFRLHGLGARMYYYQYTDRELQHLYRLVKPYDDSGLKVYVFFNNLAMFDDALRFMHFLNKGEFPSLTGSVGLDSVKTVIQRTKYPSTKSVLLKKLGWRLVEIEEGKQIRLEEILKEIPSKNYQKPEDVIEEIKKTGLTSA